jgi:hypothetical protein
VIHSDEQLISVLTTLEECRAVLASNGSRDTAQLVSVAILELRMKLNQISDAELKALCEEMTPGEASAERARDSRSSPLRRRPLLRLVK